MLEENNFIHEVDSTLQQVDAALAQVEFLGKVEVSLQHGKVDSHVRNAYPVLAKQTNDGYSGITGDGEAILPAQVYMDADLEGFGDRVKQGTKKFFEAIWKKLSNLGTFLKNLALRVYEFFSSKSEEELKELEKSKEVLDKQEKTVKDLGLAEGEKPDAEVKEQVEQMGGEIPVDAAGRVVTIDKVRRDVCSIFDKAGKDNQRSSLFAMLAINGDNTRVNNNMKDTVKVLSGMLLDDTPKFALDFVSGVYGIKKPEDAIKLLDTKDRHNNEVEKQLKALGFKQSRQYWNSDEVIGNSYIQVQIKTIGGFKFPKAAVKSKMQKPSGKRPVMTLADFEELVSQTALLRELTTKAANKSAASVEEIVGSIGAKGRELQRAQDRLDELAAASPNAAPQLKEVKAILQGIHNYMAGWASISQRVQKLGGTINAPTSDFISQVNNGLQRKKKSKK